MILLFPRRLAAGGAVCDYPATSLVVNGTTFDNGDQLGTYGAPDLSNTNISTVIDALLTRVEIALGLGDGWNQLPNAYSIGSNPDSMLKKGYAIAVGPATGTKRNQSRLMSVSRNFIVTISRSVDATDFGVDEKRDIIKLILEDLQRIVADFETYATLNSGDINISFESDSGLEFTDSESGNEFNYIQATFKVDYFEQL